jgi:hypothetical protein
MMVLIIITGILTCGAIPMFSLLGWGIETVINVFGGSVSWGYWSQAGIGFLFSALFGGIKIKIR